MKKHNLRYSTLFNTDSSKLNNEAEVETRFVSKLLKEFGYPDEAILPKSRIPQLNIHDGVSSRAKEVDFILKDSEGNAFAVVEVKSPKEDLISKAWGQAASYALSYNKDLKVGEKGIEWLLITNGLITALYPFDRATSIVTLRLEDFASGSPPFVSLKKYLKYKKRYTVREGELLFETISPAELNKLFDQCHDLIWKKEKLSPTDAFYEFCKFIFIKIREDKKRERCDSSNIFSNETPLSIAWLNATEKTTKHPIRDILFKDLREELEDAITRYGKKRIFGRDEILRLSASTCRELVSKFQSVNLSAIDEDLNGRMFERFLNQAVRGKELGQYFTPRSVVDFMTRIALEGCDVTKPFKTIDACAGTGGFLIEVMAYLIAKARNDNRLNRKEREKLVKQICDHCLYGVEGNERVSRIARINMYLHGDGGSHIFHGDGLDSFPKVEKDMIAEQRDEVNDHAKKLEPGSFNLVLTNPPFSMSYDRKNEDEKAILAQRALADGMQRAKSNLLFLDRYYELLKPGGQMLIVLDDTVLNGKTMQLVREWLLEKFILIGVHSLPFNAFFKAQANIKTSIIHLRKKTSPDEDQGHIFMSISNNIGHDNSLSDTPERNNMVDILMSYFSWKDKGILNEKVTENQDIYENLECPQQEWLLSPESLISERLDAFYYAPELKKVRASLLKLEKDKKVVLKKGKDFILAPKISRQRKVELRSSGNKLKYIEIGDVTHYGLVVKHIEGFIDELPSRGEYEIQEGDVLMAINNSSRGTVVLVSSQFSGAICTSGFLVIRPNFPEEGKLIWYALRSEYCRTQIYYLAQTASQPELKMGTWNDEFIIPVPIGSLKSKALKACNDFQSHISALLNISSVKF